MEETIINAQAEETAIVVPQLSQFQQEALEDAEKDLEKLKTELEKKKYLVDLDKRHIGIVSKFILEDAPWKFTEVLGIIEIEKHLKTATKEGKLYIDALAIEAIYYYLSKVEGKGYKTDAAAFPTIVEYKTILKAITTTMERVKIDNEKIRDAEFVVAARKEGIEPDSSIDTTSESN